MAQALAEALQRVTDALWVDIVDEVKGQSAVQAPQGPHHQQGSQAGAADADPEHVAEAATAELVAAELLNPVDLRADVVGRGGIRGELGGAQPVVTHHALLGGIGDRAGLQGLHRREGLAEARGKLLEIAIVESHPAHVQPDLQAGVEPEAVAEALPLAGGIGPIKVGGHGPDSGSGGVGGNLDLGTEGLKSCWRSRLRSADPFSLAGALHRVLKIGSWIFRFSAVAYRTSPSVATGGSPVCSDRPFPSANRRLTP